MGMRERDSIASVNDGVSVIQTNGRTVFVASVGSLLRQILSSYMSVRTIRISISSSIIKKEDLHHVFLHVFL
jgi:hypothetical protein